MRQEALEVHDSVHACRAAGATHGQELTPSEMQRLIREVGRSPWQRTTLYEAAQETQVSKSFKAADCQDCVTGTGLVPGSIGTI
jgi:hypothetical protein